MRAVLRKKNTATQPAALYGSAASGATSLTIAGGSLSGRIVAGALFGVAGVTGTYAAVSAVEVAANHRATFSILPALAGPAADGSAVTWTRPYMEYRYPAMNGATESTEKEEIPVGTRIRVLQYMPGFPAPEATDLLDGMPIATASAVGSGEPTRFRVVVTKP